MHTRTPVTIRAMTMEDVPAIAALEHVIFSDPWPDVLFRGEIRRNSAYTLVAQAVEGAEIVGYAICGFVVDEAHVENIAVVEEHRGCGVAQSLFDAILAEAVRRESHLLSLEVRAGNARAIRFYERNGFAAVALRRDYYRRPLEDAMVMIRHLPPA
jgi:ribosomal-protein-alanine N-acetyltransferase